MRNISFTVICRIVALLLCLLTLTFAFVACDGNEDDNGGNHYKDPSEQDGNGEGNNENEQGGNAENGEGNLSGDENGKDEGEGGMEIPEIELPVVPIE